MWWIVCLAGGVLKNCRTALYNVRRGGVQGMDMEGAAIHQLQTAFRNSRPLFSATTENNGKKNISVLIVSVL